MKKTNDKVGFTKSGESIVVANYHRQFGLINFFVGLMSAALIFNATYLKQSGLSATQVGLFISLSSLVGMFAPMFWGMMSDRHKTVKKIILICVLCMMVVYLPIPLYSKIRVGTMTLAPVFIVLQAGFSGTPESMVTAWVMQTQRKYHDIQYGIVRMFFTAAYALANALYMVVVEATSINAIFIGYAICASGMIIVLSRVPDIEPDENQPKRSFKEMQVSRVFKNPLLIVYILFMIFACIPSSSLGLFTPYLLEDIGANGSLLGGMVATRSVFALPMLYLSNRLVRRFGARNTLMASALIFALSQVGFVFCRTVFQGFFICAVMGLGLGMFMPSQVAFVNEEAPEGLIATTQTVCGTVYSIAGIVCNLFGSMLVDSFGIRLFYLVVSILIGSAVLFFFFATRILLRKRKSAVLQEDTEIWEENDD